MKASAAPGYFGSQGASRPEFREWMWVVAIVAAAFLVYFPALHGGFLWDDDGHVTRPELRSLAGLGRIWFEVGATQQYYPVLHSAFWLEHFAFGDATFGYHAVNVLLHATATCLFAVVLRRLGVPGARLAAVLFLLHPVCVESVAWISEQKNTLSLVFYLLAGLAYLRFDRQRRVADYATATALFVLALGSKTVTASLPAALLVVFWWQRGRVDFRRDVRPLLPWFGLAVASGLTTAWVEHALISKGRDEVQLDFVQRLLLAARAIWFYFGKLLFPADLIFVYPRWTIDAGVWWQWLFPGGIGLLAFVSWRGRRQRGAVAAGLFFAGSLFPALGFVNVYPFVFSFVADHFQYLASLGIFALAGATLTLAFASRPALHTAIVLLLGAGMAGLTWRQSGAYRNVFTLYEATLAKNPNAAMAHNNLSNELVDAGRVAEAIPHLAAVVRLRPDSAKAEYDLGHVLLGTRDWAAAISHLERALRLQPKHLPARTDLGVALMSAGQPEAAEAQFNTVLQMKPDHPDAHFNLGLLLARRDPVAAIEHFSLAARLLPTNPEPELNLAIGLMVTNRAPEALVHFERAARLAPQRADIQNLFGRALIIAGRIDDAIVHYREALTLNPNFAEAHRNLADALQKTGQAAEAARHLAEASRLAGKR